MAGDFDFFTPAQSGAERVIALPQPELRPQPPSAPASRLLPRAALAVLALLALAVASLAARVKVPEHYDNLVAHAEISADPAGWVPLYTSGDQPARWDPCATIHYVVNTRYAPPSGLRDLKGALDRVQKASGLHFVLDGESEALPSARISAVSTGGDGKLRWAPVLIAWEPLGRDEGVEGLTLPVAVNGPGGGSIVTATVAINSDLLLPPGFGPGVSEGLVVLHELGHAVGLGHVSDVQQVMYPRVKGGFADFGAGDRAGLRALGAPAGCHPAPPARELRLRLDRTG